MEPIDISIMTKEEFLDLNPCYESIQFMKSVDYDLMRAWNECHRGDWLIWFLRKTNRLNKDHSVKIAIACAEHVLFKFEEKYPENNKPKQAIEAAKRWLTNPSDITANEASKASFEACETAILSIGYSAKQAAHAASCAATLTMCTDDTITHMTNMTTSYAVSSFGIGYPVVNERKWQADKIREIIQYPF